MTCHGGITQDEGCESHSSQSQSEEYITHFCNISTVDDKVDLLYQSDMQEIVSLIHGWHHVEIVIKFEVERYSSHYEYEETESHLPSDKGEVVDPMYYEEASCEENNDSCFSSQEEDSGSICSSSHESDANWEEESTNKSEYSNEIKGMSSFSKSKSDIQFQNCIN